jgi:ferritin-like metal-binding protein YciE
MMQVAKLLEQTGNEEKAADDKLKAIAQDEVYPQAAAISHAAGVR